MLGRLGLGIVLGAMLWTMPEGLLAQDTPTKEGVKPQAASEFPPPYEQRGESKSKLLALNGGTERTEQAVAASLKWIAAHQFEDGGWSFDHGKAPQCKEQCRNPGTLKSRGRLAATAMALLPLLGSGQTPKTGAYAGAVQSGLDFLTRRMELGPHGANLSDDGGVMYGQGMATCALCEAYSMTGDKKLAEAAQQAVDYVVYCQDPAGGGWRYTPHQPGDTSVTGWQIMALKSGRLAGLKVPAETIHKAVAFLDKVQAEEGAKYGYTEPGPGPATTAVGLLCRLCTGWKPERPAIQRGADWLAQAGPARSNVYYNYYATQVLFNLGGERWDKWNGTMREQLIAAQAAEGHETGSWAFAGDMGTSTGGRLYATVMSALTLEVYYRYLPLRIQPFSFDAQ